MIYIPFSRIQGAIEGGDELEVSVKPGDNTIVKKCTIVSKLWFLLYNFIKELVGLYISCIITFNMNFSDSDSDLRLLYIVFSSLFLEQFKIINI